MMSSGVAIRIRRYQPADAPLIFEAARESTATVHRWLPWCHPDYTEAEARAWLQQQIPLFDAGRELEHAIVSAEGRFLGGCGLNAIRREGKVANLGYWVRTSEQGRGVAPAAVRLLVAWAHDHTVIERIEVLVASGNAASLRVAEKAGATRERVDAGRLTIHGVRHDAVVLSFTLAPRMRLP